MGFGKFQNLYFSLGNSYLVHTFSWPLSCFKLCLSFPTIISRPTQLYHILEGPLYPFQTIKILELSSLCLIWRSSCLNNGIMGLCSILDIHHFFLFLRAFSFFLEDCPLYCQHDSPLLWNKGNTVLSCLFPSITQNFLVNLKLNRTPQTILVLPLLLHSIFKTSQRHTDSTSDLAMHLSLFFTFTITALLWALITSPFRDSNRLFGLLSP